MKRIWPLIAAIAAFALGTIVWIAHDHRAPAHAYDYYSTLSTNENGLSLAFKYLARSGNRKVGILTRPLGALLEPDAVVFRVTRAHVSFYRPETELKKGPKRERRETILTRDEEAFVSAGGRLVIATEEELLDIHEIPQNTPAHRVFPVWPAVELVKVPHAHAFGRLTPRMTALYNAGAKPVIARERIGNGEVYVVAAPDALVNAAVGDNLPLLMSLATPTRPVYFDEVPHGISDADGALGLLKEWNFGPFLLLLLGFGLLILWRNTRRVGPAEDDHRDTRSDAVDLVHSLGALYGRTTTDAEAVKLYYDSLTRSVAAQLGLRGDALHKRVAALTGDMVLPTGTKLPPAELRRHLDTLNEAFSKLRPHDRLRGRTGGAHGNHH